MRDSVEQSAPTWTAPEIWVWENVRKGLTANFHERFGALDPTQADGWVDERELSPAFIEQVLLDSSFRRALPRQGLRIIGAWVRQPLSLQNAQVEHEIWLDKSRFEANCSLARLRSSSALSFAESFFGGSFSMMNARIEGRVNLRAATLSEAADFNSIEVNAHVKLSDSSFSWLSLDSARIRGSIDLVGARSSELLSMEDVDVSGDVFCRSSTLGEITLSGAKIGGQLSLKGARCNGAICMQGAQIGSDLFFEKSTLASVDLIGAIVGGQLVLDAACCTGKLDMQGIVVGADLFMGWRDETDDMHARGTFADVVLAEAKIGGRLDMSGAMFNKSLDLSGAVVSIEVQMRDVHAIEVVDMRNARVGAGINMAGAQLKGAVEMDRIDIGADLSMRDSCRFKTIRLVNAKVGGSLNIASASCSGLLNMNGIEIGRHLLMKEGSDFAGIELRSARVRGQVQMQASRFEKKLDMDGLEVGGHMFMRESATFNEVTFRDGHVHGDLIMTRADCRGKIDLEAARIDGSLCTGIDTYFRDSLEMVSGSVGRDIDFSGSVFESRVNLRGSAVTGMMCLGTDSVRPPLWAENSELVLGNTRVAIVQDHPRPAQTAPDSWPMHILLDGFVYQRLSGDRNSMHVQLAQRDIRWFADWQKRDAHFRPESYAQLARVLVQQGYPEKANAILYAGRERDRREHAKGLRWLGLSLLKITIGYGIGYRYLWSLGWVCLFAAIGWSVFRTVQPAPFSDSFSLILFSIDQLLPVFKLMPGADDASKLIHGWQQHYLVLHRAAGFLLSSFVVAGLSGITKK